MALLTEITTYVDELLQPQNYHDYCPNGLQVEGRAEVRGIVSGVTASQALIDTAVEQQADALLVHHGYFWKGEDPRLVGIKGRRIATLLNHGINLLAYHLPLDDHPTLGNNAQLAHVLEFPINGRFGAGPDGGLGLYGDLATPLEVPLLTARIARALGREPLVIEGGGGAIRRVAWCSGAAQGYLEAAAAAGADAFISGEVSEPTFHIARELGIHYFAAGHHATERYGVRALGEQLARHFGLEHQFVDLFNPV